MGRSKIRVSKPRLLGKTPIAPSSIKRRKVRKINTLSRHAIGNSGERVVSDIVQHCNRPLRDLNETEGENFPGSDHICDNCGTGFQVKTGRSIKQYNGKFYFPKSKTFESTYWRYNHFRYIFVQYDGNGQVNRIIISKRLDSSNIDGNSIVADASLDCYR